MNLKDAALLALCGSALLAILLVTILIRNVLGVVGGFVPALTLVESLIYTFAALSAVLFLYAFHKRQW
jgi:hypothetical protein